MKAVLIRHGETDYNAKGIYQGYGPIPLSQRGRRQAALVAARVPAFRPSVLYSSDILRAHETAEFISQALGMSIEPCEGLREWNIGAWENKRAEEVEALLEANGGHIATYVPEGGESLVQTQARVVAQMSAFAAQHANETIVCVSHGKSIDLFARHILGLDVMHTPAYSITNTSVSIFSHQDDTWQLVTLNEIQHLEALVE